ncbi:MAG: hypothetical protein O3B31_13555 [Chloroflexi bacterium]|nr:hypothetical protein [Chloroflexota bacterium]MDA1004348.1 hypothetical protein [Chloroflexota bacterium]
MFPLLVLGIVFGVYVYFFRPPWFRRLGKRASVVGYAYVAAILISAAFRLAFGWGV